MITKKRALDIAIPYGIDGRNFVYDLDAAGAFAPEPSPHAGSLEADKELSSLERAFERKQITAGQMIAISFMVGLRYQGKP
jgi:hypothetical protein